MPYRRRLAWLLAGPLLCLLLLPAPVVADSLKGRVSWIHDGDTIEISGIGTVRLLGIDAPEHEASRRDSYYQRWNISPATLRKIHREGKVYLIQSLKGQTVYLTAGQEKRDRHKRLLAYVYLPDGRLLNRLLLDKGYAVVYRRFDFEFKDDFLEAEAKAKQKGIGLWRSE